MKKLSAIIFMLLASAAVFSADEASPAILARGPLAHSGIEYLGLNTISSQYGEYSFGDDAIIIYFTNEEIILSENWVDADCRNTDALIKKGIKGRKIVSYTDAKGWTAFFSFEPESNYICDFIETYKNRQNYFLNIARDDTAFSFPALLEINPGD